MKHYFEVWVLRGYIWDKVHAYVSTRSHGAWVNYHYYKNHGPVQVLVDGNLYHQSWKGA